MDIEIILFEYFIWLTCGDSFRKKAGMYTNPSIILPRIKIKHRINVKKKKKWIFSNLYIT